MNYLRPTLARLLRPTSFLPTITTTTAIRPLSTTPVLQSWLLPKKGDKGSTRKGRPRVPTGGSVRGTTIVWGDFGMRMTDHHRRLSALVLKNAEDTIKRKLRGMKYRLFTRISANIPVYTKGNETRMGTGKGSMDFWAARVPVSAIVFELKGEIHEQVVRDAFRVAGAKLPGKWEFVRKGDVPVMGVTKLTPQNVEKLRAGKFSGNFNGSVKFPLDKTASADAPVPTLTPGA
ncbi:mitochondrial ribosomal protein L16 [Geopyxis carbonaria]|nr:mitochondrial ribosomal protein L16 [Geopyxis carbonaria]